MATRREQRDVSSEMHVSFGQVGWTRSILTWRRAQSANVKGGGVGVRTGGELPHSARAGARRARCREYGRLHRGTAATNEEGKSL